MKIYTKTGDSGTTSLTGGERVDKWDPRVEAYGAVDELMADVALLADTIADRGFKSSQAMRVHGELEQIVSTLMTVAALFSQGAGARQLPDLRPEQVEWLEGRIDAISAGLPPLRTFTLPGGHTAVSMAHVCRTVCRRAERIALAANAEYPLPANALVWLNRLSDYFYVAARELSAIFGVKERAWVLE